MWCWELECHFALRQSCTLIHTNTMCDMYVKRTRNESKERKNMMEMKKSVSCFWLAETQYRVLIVIPGARRRQRFNQRGDVAQVSAVDCDPSQGPWRMESEWGNENVIPCQNVCLFLSDFKILFTSFHSLESIFTNTFLSSILSVFL